MPSLAQERHFLGLREARPNEVDSYEKTNPAHQCVNDFVVKIFCHSYKRVWDENSYKTLEDQNPTNDRNQEGPIWNPNVMVNDN